MRHFPVLTAVLGALLAFGALPSLAQENGSGASHTPHAFHLPASYMGTIPCADCPSIRMILTMTPDSAYLLRREYKGAAGAEDRAATVHGRWRLDQGGRVLYLFSGAKREASFTILPDDSLRMRDQADQEIVSELNYSLVRAGGLDPIRDVLDLTGYFSHSAAGDFYTDCQAGRTIPVAKEGAYEALVSAYGTARRTPGEAVLVSLSGRLEWRDKADGKGSERVLAVEKVKRFWRGYRCGDELPIFKLESGIWELMELHGALVNVRGAMQRPSMEFQPGESKVVGFGACNRFTATYESAEETLRIGPAAATKMACADDGGTLESSFFLMLGRVTRYEVSGPVLVLYDGDELMAKLRLRG